MRQALVPRRFRPSAGAVVSLAAAALVLVVLALPGVAAEPPATAPQGTAGAASTPEAGAAARERLARLRGGDGESATSRAVASSWWNQDEQIARLALGEEQRREMNALLRESLRARQEAVRGRREAQKRFVEALEAGHPAAAEEPLTELAEAQGALLRAQLELRVGVARLLTAKQRTALAAAEPRIWRQPWVGTTRRAEGDRSDRRATRGQRSRPAAAEH